MLLTVVFRYMPGSSKSRSTVTSLGPGGPTAPLPSLISDGAEQQNLAERSLQHARPPQQTGLNSQRPDSSRHSRYVPPWLDNPHTFIYIGEKQTALICSPFDGTIISRKQTVFIYSPFHGATFLPNTSSSSCISPWEPESESTAFSRTRTRHGSCCPI